MDAWLAAGFANASMVFPLALLAWLVSRWFRRPALTHAVWVIVLLKFVTPPIYGPATFGLPIGLTLPAPIATAWQQAWLTILPANNSAFANWSIPNSNVPSDNATQLKNITTGNSAATRPNSIFTRTNPSSSDKSSTDPTRPLAATGLPSMQASVPASTVSVSIIVVRALLGLWILGSVGWVLMQLWHAMRFEWLLTARTTVPAGLKAQADDVAQQLDLSAPPGIRVVEATMSPMLWGFGGWAKLVFPAGLAQRLQDHSRATLIAHEYAHFVRGDHYVRLLEFVATAFFWWHPILWVARVQIEQAEEECCDAWVVSKFPKSHRQYAEALLDTIDFLCEKRRALPPIASGLGYAPFLRRRLTQIMLSPNYQPLSRSTRWQLLIVALALLPLSPFAVAAPHQAALTTQVALDGANLSEVSTQPDDASDDTAKRQKTKTQTPRAPMSRVDKRREQLRIERQQLAQQRPSVNDQPTPDSNPSQSTRRPTERIWSTAVSVTGQLMIRVTEARELLLVNTDSGTTTDLSRENITCVAFLPSGGQFVSAGSDGRLALWNGSTGQLIRLLERFPVGLRSVAVSSTGEFVAAGTLDGLVIVQQLGGNGRLEYRFSKDQSVDSVRFSPNGELLAAAVGDWSSNRAGFVGLLQLPSLKLAFKLPCDAAPGALSFASNDELIVGEWRGRVHLWNLNTQRIVAYASTSKNDIAAASFSPDNPQLTAVSFLAAGTLPPESSFEYELRSQTPGLVDSPIGLGVSVGPVFPVLPPPEAIPTETPRPGWFQSFFAPSVNRPVVAPSLLPEVPVPDAATNKPQ
jgi:bla regulator protein blaR1